MYDEKQRERIYAWRKKNKEKFLKQKNKDSQGAGF